MSLHKLVINARDLALKTSGDLLVNIQFTVESRGDTFDFGNPSAPAGTPDTVTALCSFTAIGTALENRSIETAANGVLTMKAEDLRKIKTGSKFSLFGADWVTMPSTRQGRYMGSVDVVRITPGDDL